MSAEQVERERPQCRRVGCDKPARANGYCDTDYRRDRRGWRPGKQGTPPKDKRVYKIRVKNSNGSQPIYYSDREKAFETARKAKENGSLMFFGSYTIEEAIDLDLGLRAV